MIMRLTGQRPALRHCDLTGLWYAVERPSNARRIEVESNGSRTKSCRSRIIIVTSQGRHHGVDWGEHVHPTFAMVLGLILGLYKHQKSFLLQGA